MSAQRYKGFTLIELMVVISIIAILAIIAYSIYSDVQRNGRDTKRKVDIDSISATFESKYNTLSSTPYLRIVGTDFTTGIIPIPPSGTTESDYVFVSDANYATKSVDGIKYKVCTKLERVTGNSNLNTGVYSYVATNTGTHYCKESQQ